jgi:phage host-nuclease inhibitor protein Gam
MARVQKPITLVLSSLAEVDETLRQIGATERAMIARKDSLASEIARLKAEASTELAPQEKVLEGLISSLELYATTNRVTLLTDGKKSVSLPGGEFGWRMTPPKVTFGKGGAKAALVRFLALKLKKYLRYTPEIDHEALLRDRPVIAGIKYTQVDAFYVKANSEKSPETFPGAVARH